MFKIFDGREHFFQWDSDCKLIIDDGRISAVHFCNRTIDYAIVCNVYKENGQYLVNVPNIFFQSDRDLHVYAYDDSHTLYEETYKVFARSKPADYVYKDDEVLTWARIEQRVTDLENTVSTEGIAQAVEDYMAANPIQIPAEYVTETELEAKGYITTIPSNYVTEESLSSKGYLTSIPAEYVTETELNAKGYLTSYTETDPTVPEWAKQSDKPTYTASEVGALPDTTTIPTKTSELTNDSGYLTVIPSEYITETELEAKGYLTEHQSLAGYATTNDVATAVSDKVSTTQLNTAIAGFVSQAYVDEKIAAIPEPDLSGYALKSEIPDDYILPTASATTLGGVKPDGTSITIAEDGTISGAGENVLKVYNGYSVNLTRQTANEIKGGLCVAAGGYNTLNGYYGFTSGSSNTLSADNGTAFGRNNSIYAMVGFTAGDYCEVNGYRGTAFGNVACANKQNTFAIGDHTKANSDTQFVCGKFNIIDDSLTYAVIVGNGEGDRSNAYTLDWSGNAVFAGTVSNSGADYAEYFEWLDGNTDNEDRVGFIVTLEGDKIKKANDGDDMLGIISGTMTVLGDDAEWYWHGRYLKDEFGRIQYHYVDEDVIECQRFENEDGTIEWRDVVVGKKQVLYPIVNPKYDATKIYVSRKDRKEWNAVGMLGKLYVRDDGTCKVNQYAKCGNDGIATAADCITNMRVLQRVNDNIIRVLLK